MYLAMGKKWFSSLYHTVWRRNVMRSGMLTGLILAMLVLGLGIAYRERGRGHLHKLEQKIVTERQDAPVPHPGGREAVVLTRTRLAGGSVPEFLTVTMLPGRGMNVLQITAYLPDKGEVSLMASPLGRRCGARDDGMQGADAAGGASLTMGGSRSKRRGQGRIWGTPAQGGERGAAGGGDARVS